MDEVNDSNNLEPSQPSQPSLPPDLIAQFLTIQEKEIEAKAYEFKIREKEIDASAEEAKIAIGAQKEDLKDSRVHARKMTKSLFFFLGFVFLILCVLIALAVIYGKENLVEDFLKVTIPSVASLVAGFFWGKSRGIKQQNDDD